MPDKLTLELAQAMADSFEALADRVSAVEQQQAMRKAARAVLRDAGYSTPSDDQVDRVVDEFVRKRYTARRASAEPPIVLDERPGWTMRTPDGRVVALGTGGDDQERAWFDSPR